MNKYQEALDLLFMWATNGYYALEELGLFEKEDEWLTYLKNHKQIELIRFSGLEFDE